VASANGTLAIPLWERTCARQTDGAERWSAAVAHKCAPTVVSCAGSISTRSAFFTCVSRTQTYGARHCPASP